MLALMALMDVVLMARGKRLTSALTSWDLSAVFKTKQITG